MPRTESHSYQYGADCHRAGALSQRVTSAPSDRRSISITFSSKLRRRFTVAMAVCRLRSASARISREPSAAITPNPAGATDHATQKSITKGFMFQPPARCQRNTCVELGRSADSTGGRGIRRFVSTIPVFRNHDANHFYPSPLPVLPDSTSHSQIRGSQNVTPIRAQVCRKHTCLSRHATNEVRIMRRSNQQPLVQSGLARPLPRVFQRRTGSCGRSTAPASVSTSSLLQSRVPQSATGCVGIHALDVGRTQRTPVDHIGPGLSGMAQRTTLALQQRTIPRPVRLLPARHGGDQSRIQFAGPRAWAGRSTARKGSIGRNGC